MKNSENYIVLRKKINQLFFSELSSDHQKIAKEQLTESEVSNGELSDQTYKLLYYVFIKPDPNNIFTKIFHKKSIQIYEKIEELAKTLSIPQPLFWRKAEYTTSSMPEKNEKNWSQIKKTIKSIAIELSGNGKKYFKYDLIYLWRAAYVNWEHGNLKIHDIEMHICLDAKTMQFKFFIGATIYLNDKNAKLVQNYFGEDFKQESKYPGGKKHLFAKWDNITEQEAVIKLKLLQSFKNHNIK